MHTGGDHPPAHRLSEVSLEDSPRRATPAVECNSLTRLATGVRERRGCGKVLCTWMDSKHRAAEAVQGQQLCQTALDSPKPGYARAEQGLELHAQRREAPLTAVSSDWATNVLPGAAQRPAPGASGRPPLSPFLTKPPWRIFNHGRTGAPRLLGARWAHAGWSAQRP